jgi:hypothetical protein
MAQEVGTGLGAGAVLLGSVSEEEKRHIGRNPQRDFRHRFVA